MLHLDPIQGPKPILNAHDQLQQISKSNSWNRFLVIKDGSLQSVGLLTYLFGKNVTKDASQIKDQAKNFIIGNQGQFSKDDAKLIRQLSNNAGFSKEDKEEIYTRVISKFYGDETRPLSVTQTTKKVDSLFNLEDVRGHKIPNSQKPTDPK